MNGSHHRLFLNLFLISLLANILMNYGGTRSLDSEIKFRVAESLAEGKGFVVQEPLGTVPDFGVARGLDGQLYAVWAPGQSLVMAPLIWLAKRVNIERWYKKPNLAPPLSHHVGDLTENGLLDFIFERRPPDEAPHSLRFGVSFLNSLVTAGSVVLLAHIIVTLTGSSGIAFITGLLYALATLAWPYAGTMFAEPLSTLCLVGSLDVLLYAQYRRKTSGLETLSAMFLSGLLLGCAPAVHHLETLFIPFFWGYALYLAMRGETSKKTWPQIIVFSLGLCVMPSSMLYYNWHRFGHPLVTGRSADQAGFLPQWEGLVGLLFGSANGLLWYCPLAIAGILSLPTLAKENRPLAWMIGSLSLTRYLIVSQYWHWHGGFGLGPRFLVPLIPFSLLPLAAWLKQAILTKQRRKLVGFALFSLLGFVEQIYFCCTEVFSYFHIIHSAGLRIGINLLINDRLYRDWSVSPLLNMYRFRIGPFLLRNVAIGNRWALSIVAVILVLIALLLLTSWHTIRQLPEIHKLLEGS